MTIPGAVALIGRLSTDPSLLIGAGTVSDAATAQACLDAGARFWSRPGSIRRWLGRAGRRGALPMLGADSDRSAGPTGGRGAWALVHMAGPGVVSYQPIRDTFGAKIRCD